MKKVEILVACCVLFAAATFVCSKVMQTETSDLLSANIEALAQNGEEDSWERGYKYEEVSKDVNGKTETSGCCVSASWDSACNVGKVGCKE